VLHGEAVTLNGPKEQQQPIPHAVINNNKQPQNPDPSRLKNDHKAAAER